MAAAQKKQRMTWGEVFPNLCIASTSVSVATVGFTYPQVITVSKGLLPPPTSSATLAVLARTMPFQIPMKFCQFTCMRTLKFKLDDISPGTASLNTMVSYGTTGVPFQSVLYNQCISDIYKYHNASPPQLGGSTFADQAKSLFWKKVYPGIAWCFLRECCATGGALVLGPMLSPKYTELIGDDYPVFVRFAGGLTAGACTAFLTQWLHNTCLTAGSMAEMGENPTTGAVIRRTYQNLGPSMIYRNYGRRMMVIACASASLNVFQLFV
eukprot:TRINITY_DN28453_c0_g1_i1.p2 TRINITY_DN28453_c0_g1~~TRINITY_DN28453_c0_g1_i1.p2  ORF type:complete len:294 (+),score=92.70 TRINITY_DN28453_c0_g1_i1:84-884(+)